MMKLFPSLIVGFTLAIVPFVILKLPTDSGMIGSLKWWITNLMIPGNFVGLFAAGDRIDDVNPWLSGLVNFAFYSGLAYLSLMVWVNFKARAGRRPPGVV
jgi:hypothetical protein